MTGIRVLISRVLDLLFSGRRERRLDEEIRNHLDLLADQYVADGMTPIEARDAARRAFGGVEQMKESYRDQRGLPLVDALRQDFRFAIRLLNRNRGFAITAVLVLGIGIGVNNMLFTILNTHTLRGLPMPASHRVLWLSTVDDRGRERGLSFADYQDIAGGVQHYAGLAAFEGGPMVIAGDGRTADRLDGAYVTANAFDLIEIQPLLGRSFAASDDRPGAAGVAVLTRTAWESRYGADAGAVGRTISLNGVPVTLIGIVADRSGFPGTAQIWMPLTQLPGVTTRTRDARTLQVFGRVADGARVDEAIAEVTGIADRLSGEHPATNRNTRARVVPINSRFLGNARDGVWRAFITVGFIVVLISCANVANLMLDRSLLRARELAIRASVGGSRRRLLRQLLVEGLVIAAFGAGTGLLVAIGGVRVFRRAIPADALPYWFDYSLDWRVLTALIAVSAATVLVFALVPAIQASRTDVLTVRKEGGRSAGAGRRRVVATMFLAAQLALAVVLLAHLAVNVRLDRSGLASDAIFDNPEIVTAAVTLPPASYPTATALSAFYESLLARLHAVNSQVPAAIASTLPASGGEPRAVVIDGKRGPDQGDEQTTLAIAITPEYFRALGLALLQGRELQDQDGNPGRENAIVNLAFAEKFLGGESILGRRIQLGTSDPRSHATGWLTIVGVAPDIRQRRGRTPEPVVYTPFRPDPPATAALIVRSPIDSGGLVAMLRQQVQALDPALPIFRARTLPQVRRDLDWNGRVSNGLFLFLAFIAVALATFGLYAVTTHAVSQERHEIGIRMALGARTHQIIARVLRRLLVQVSFGFAAGVVCTMLWERMFPPGDPNIHAADPVSLTLVALALVGLMTIAAAVPSRRASRVDPLLAIRGE
jgi:putative ABC transport system permease protein